MTNNLIPLLDELSQLAPDICTRKDTEFAGTWYTIDDYEFGWHNGDFSVNYSIAMITGNPAYDWLQGALIRVIREQGMYWELRYSKPRNRYQAEIANHTVWNNDATEALLTAFIQALRGE